MAGSKVYVITADADHECNTPIRAYAGKPQADAFMERVREHASRRPSPPEATGDPERNEAADDAWYASQETWAARHPAGKEWAYYGSDFTIHELRVIP